MRAAPRSAGPPFARALAAGALIATLLAALVVAFWAPPARASYEEFLTLDVAKQEEDDENLLDHILVQLPLEWRDEWEQARGGFRSSQGCFTSGRWYLANDLKVRVPMGDTTFLLIDMVDISDVESAYSWTQFDIRFPLPRLGLWGVRLRPTFDKSRHDMALLWDRGVPDAPFTVQAVMGLEDAFNKFWSSRQVRVGDESEPYERHPFEPSLRLGWRRPGTRVTAGGKWLTPSVKRHETDDPALRRRVHLWGTKADASVAQRFGAWTPELGFEMVQASTFQYWDVVPGDHHVFRRRWRADGALSRTIGEHGRLTFRFVYQERAQVWRPPIRNNTLAVIDRMPMVESAFQAPFHTRARVGLMRNRVTVTGVDRDFTWTEGDRLETRAFVALQVRFGRVLIQGTECLELNREAYDVAFIHDKGFLHFQTTF